MAARFFSTEDNNHIQKNKMAANPENLKITSKKKSFFLLIFVVLFKKYNLLQL